LNFLKAVNRELIEPIVVLPEDGFLVERLQELNIPTEIIPFGRLEKNFLKIIWLILGLPKVLFCINKILKKGIDLIYCNTLVNIYGGLLSIISRKPCIYHIHEAKETYGKLLFKFLVFFVQQTARRIILVSQATASSFDHCKEKCVVIYNGINHSEYERVNRARQPISYPRISKAWTCIALIGSIGFNKGQLLLVESLFILKDRHQNLHCLLAGKLAKKSSTQAYFKQLNDKVSAYGMAERVHYLGVCEDVKELLTISSILVLPSYSECHPLVILEAMAAGVPVIATNVGGIPEIIHHETNGILIPTNNSEALAHELSRLIEDKELCYRIVRNAKITVREKFSLDQMARNIESVLLDS